MLKNFNNSTWVDILKQFSSYQGTVNCFCKENNISKNQFYYYRKKLKDLSNLIFDLVILNKNITKKSVISNSEQAKEIRIKIGLANIYIPTNEIAILPTILKELVKYK